MTSRLHASHDSAFTKGPWSFTRYGYEKHAIADDRGTEIGFVHRARDARLIAAAPELLEALENLRWAHTDETDAQALAAIAKARGQQVQP